MKHLLITFLSVILFSYTGSAQARKKAEKDTKEWRYEIEGVQQGVSGTYLIKVWSYSKKRDVALEQAKKMQFMELYLEVMLELAEYLVNHL